MNTTALISELDKQIARLREARNLLAGVDQTSTRRTRTTPAKGPRKTRVLTAEARAKMAAAQKRRWAAYRRSK